MSERADSQSDGVIRPEFPGTLDVFGKAINFDRAQVLKDNGWYPYYPALSGSDGTTVTLNGREMIMVGSNNYLGLTHDPRVLAAGHAALDEFGSGCTGSRFLNGTLQLHVDLERKLAAFFQREDSLVFATGMQANLGSLSTLCQRGDVIFTDRENHASIFDGCKLSFGKVVKYVHADMDDLARKLELYPDNPKVIVSDGVFSMSGEYAKMDDLVRLRREHGARLIMDEAHSVGVCGENGRGVPEVYGVEDEVDLIIGTFSKSFGGVGGFCVGDSRVIDYVKHTSRAIIFSAALPPATVAMVCTSLDILQAEPERRERLWEIANRMRNEFTRLGFDTLNSRSCVIPILVGEEIPALEMFHDLLDAGVFTNPVITPAVPPGFNLLRTSYIATHTDEQMDRVLEAFATVGKKYGLIQ